MNDRIAEFNFQLNKGIAEDNLKIPSLRTGKISLGDIIAATIGEDARLCDNDSEIQSDVNTEDAPNIDIQQDLNFSFYFNENSSDNLHMKNSSETANGDLFKLCTDKGNFSASAKLQNVPEVDQNSNTGDSFFQDDSVDKDFLPVFPNLSSDIAFDKYDDFIESLIEPKSNQGHNQTGNSAELNLKDSSKTPHHNHSDDSDLEDSMHFVDPDDQSNIIKIDSEDHEVPEPRLKKRRLSDITPLSSINHDFDSKQSDLIALFYAETNEVNAIRPKQKSSAFARRRSFSGTSDHRMRRQCGLSKLNQHNRSTDKYKTPRVFRARSFSEACNSEQLTPINEGRALDTSLSSLLGSPNENSPLSHNPFYEDLKCTLLSDLSNSATDDCPKALFDTLCEGQNSDVYARERNLQSRFSILQSKYPDEVRDISSFYRQQSAEIETERFREIHNERFPLSYRNHLNRYYDNLLHTIMERVEKSLQLLSKAKKESVYVCQGFRPRPLLSRKAVSMMEEWYTRNYEHPYPSQTAVEALAAAGEITTEQVKKWFANKRNRSKNTRPVIEEVTKKRKRQFSSRW